MEPKSSVSFILNNLPVRVDGASVMMSLNEWIRAQPGLTGTKRMCTEGGCGCCMVSASFIDQTTQKKKTIAVNSVAKCRQDEEAIFLHWVMHQVNGPHHASLHPPTGPSKAIINPGRWKITTVEGIGSSSTDFSPIQTKLAEYNGSQCGYCSPGFVMSMYSLLRENPKASSQIIEDNFDGNLCRCTGYRPILDAMKSFAVECDNGGLNVDIEDLGSTVCPSTGEICNGRCFQRLNMSHCGPQWFRPLTLGDISAIFAANQSKKIKFLAGDTGKGVFKTMLQEDIDAYVDLKGVSQLYSVEIGDSSLTVGAAITLSSLIKILQNNHSKSSSFEHLVNHLHRVANVSVRNMASWAGNLMLSHIHGNSSDIFTMMVGTGAKVIIASLLDLSTSELSLCDFLNYDMNKSIITKLIIPYTREGVVVRSYKVMPRAQNSRARVNATFSMAVDANDHFTVTEKPTLVFGYIDSTAVLADATAKFLYGKSLLDSNTFKEAILCLEKEIVPKPSKVGTSVEYRKSAAIGLFYKFYLAAIPDHLSQSVLSVTKPNVRPISHGQQCYTPNPSEFPVGQPMTKVTAKLQCSGEAEFTTDIPTINGELAAAFVLTKQANAEVVSIDSSAAEQLPGFVKFLTVADIPPGGTNCFISERDIREEIFVEKYSAYAGQAIGVVIADSQNNANRIAQAVLIEYKSLGTPLIMTEDAIKAKSFYTNPAPQKIQVGDAATAIANSDHIISGEISCGSQYHFYMETHGCLCVPKEGGYEVYSSTQWPAEVQYGVAGVMGVPTSSVDVSVRRVGGAFGGKAKRPKFAAIACALGAHATNRPVRMHMDLSTNMRLLGLRLPYQAYYKIGSTKEGVLNGIQIAIYCDCGANSVDNRTYLLTDHIDNAYHAPNWEINNIGVMSHKPPYATFRGPGKGPAIFIMESMMDHLANSLNLDVEDVKRMNLYRMGQATPTGMTLKYCNISSLWNQLYQSAKVADRKERVEDFNKTNRWHKRGINMMPLRYGIEWGCGFPYTVLVNIYATDGTVAVSHGGVEVGQGINTKIIQVAAKTLGIPMDMIKVKPCHTTTTPNSTTTRASLTSEMNGLGTIKACEELNSRIQPIREQNPNLAWPDLIKECFRNNVDLSAKYCVTENPADYRYCYNSYAAAVTEVEIDVLTGESQVLRVDILYDCGTSMNPEIDVGQIEGAFVMGLGYWFTEKIVFDKISGEMLTHNTWEYKPPSSKDIPIDFRVELLRDAPNPVGVLGSKAVGEPPHCLSCSALFAVKRAIESARKDGGNFDFFPLAGPATVEEIHKACVVNPSTQFEF